jgi:1,3-beta-glucan synthase
MERSLISISIVIVITFLPLFTHLLLETGLWSACKRLFKQWLSLSLLFEVFVAQVHASAFLSSLKNAKAKYHATGRGLAISRQSFISLYAAFSRSCILFGMELTLLLAYVGTHIWIPHFGYFCVVCVGLAVSPFLFNPYQFGWTHTMVDYGQWLSWMWTDKDASWSRFVRGARVQVTGLDKTDGSVKRAWCPWFVHGVFPLTKAFVLVTFYLMGPGLSGRALAAVVRAVVLFGAPLLLMSVVCLLPRGWTKLCTLVSFVGWFIALVLVEGQNMSRVLLLLLTLLYLFSLFTSVVTALLPREPPTPTQGFRTFLCTLLDHLQFPVDMVVGHVLFVPLMVLTFIPFINRLHTTFLLWIPPWVPTSRGIYSAAQRRRRRHLAIKYLAYFLLILALTVVTCACLFTL